MSQAQDNRANPNLPIQAQRPDDPSEGTRKDTNRNDRSTVDRVRHIRGDVFMDGQQIRPVDPDQPDVDPIMAPENLSPVQDPEIQEFRKAMMNEVVKSRKFIRTYTDILKKGDQFARAGSDYFNRVSAEIANHNEDIWDFFNEDERLFHKRSILP